MTLTNGVKITLATLIAAATIGCGPAQANATTRFDMIPTGIAADCAGGHSNYAVSIYGKRSDGRNVWVYKNTGDCGGLASAIDANLRSGNKEPIEIVGNETSTSSGIPYVDASYIGVRGLNR